MDGELVDCLRLSLAAGHRVCVSFGFFGSGLFGTRHVVVVCLVLVVRCVLSCVLVHNLLSGLGRIRGVYYLPADVVVIVPVFVLTE